MGQILRAADRILLHPWTTRAGAIQAIIGVGILAAALAGGLVTLVLGFPLGWAILSALGTFLLASTGTATLIERYRARRGTDQAAARRHAWHVIGELDTIQRTAQAALENGHFWNVRLEGLPATEWDAGRDALADAAPDVYDAVWPIYTQADQLNKTAGNYLQGGVEGFQEDVAERLAELLATVDTGRGALRDFCGVGGGE